MPLDKNEIRLICIQPGVGTEDLEADILVANIASRPHYDVLSYVWGSDPNKHKIKLSSGPVLMVGVDAAKMLMALRHPKSPKVVWIDAICIDQDDVLERNAQIQIMSLIFKQASNLCIWLGDNTPWCETAFEFVTRIEESLNAIDTMDEDYLINGLKAFYVLVLHPWFRRRWCVQEIMLAHSASLHISTKTLPWQTFADAVASVTPTTVWRLNARIDSWRLKRNVWHLGDGHSDFFFPLEEQAVGRLIKLINKPHITTLEFLVAYTCHLVSSDARDVVYGMVGIASNARMLANGDMPSIGGASLRKGFLPRLATSSTPVFKADAATMKQHGSGDILVDYSKPILEVYKEFVAFSIQHSGSLDIICQPWAWHHPGWPSWICTVDKHAFAVYSNNQYYRHNADCLAQKIGDLKSIYTTSKQSEPIYKTSPGLRCQLVVDGFVLDCIESAAPPAMDGSIPAQWTDIAGWTIIESPPPDRFWRTLVANRDSSHSLPPLHYRNACRDFFQYKSHYDDLLPRRLPPRSSDLISRNSSFPFEFAERVRATTWGRRLVITEQETLLGLAPTDCEEGDLVCVILGCSVPVILREVYAYDRVGEPRFKVIGEAYIHDMMDGEAMSLREKEGIPYQSFTLE